MRTAALTGWSLTMTPSVVRGEVEALKVGTSGLLVVFGSGELVKDLARHGLIDEFHLLVQPVALGSGLPLFDPGLRTDLVLTSSTALRSGVVRQFYAPAVGPVERINYSS
jgi:dihydrofolate reductase